MTIANWITIAAFVLTNGVGLIVSWTRLNYKIHHLEREFCKHTDAAEKRCQSREEYVERTFARKDLAEQQMAEIKQSIAEIKALDLASRFTRIETQLTAIQSAIEELRGR